MQNPGMQSGSNTPHMMRRQPLQGRSQKRVEEILDAAACVFEETGYEAATTNAIAERAGTSIGSLYRFFPDKTAIFQALSVRYLEQMQQTSAQMLQPAVLSLPLAELLKETIEAFHSLIKSQPGLKAIWLYAEASPELRQIDREMSRQTVRQIASLLAEKTDLTDPDRLLLVARVSVEIMNTLMRLLVLEPEEMAPTLKCEFGNLMMLYLSQHMRQEDGELNR